MAVYLYRKYRSKRAQKSDGQPWSDPVRLDDMIDSESQRPSSAEHFLPQQNESAEQQQQKQEMRIYRWRLVAGLFVPASVQALNTTMIAGALPYIASDFSKLALIHYCNDLIDIFKINCHNSIGSSQRTTSQRLHSSHSGASLQMSLDVTSHYKLLPRS